MRGDMFHVERPEVLVRRDLRDGLARGTGSVRDAEALVGPERRGRVLVARVGWVAVRSSPSAQVGAP